MSKWGWLLVAVAVFLGIGFGVSVTMIVLPTVLLRPVANDFLKSFSPQTIAQGVTAAPLTWTEAAPGSGPGHVRARHFEAHGTLSEAAQVRFMNAFRTALTNALNTSGGWQYSNSSSSSSSRTPKGQNRRQEHFHLDYQSGSGVRGTIHVWGIGLGEDFTVIVSIQEREVAGMN